jgi:hypothetical protein
VRQAHDRERQDAYLPRSLPGAGKKDSLRAVHPVFSTSGAKAKKAAAKQQQS